MRIKYISTLLKGANTVLDIGTDHGKVLIEAISNGYIKKGIASDINEGPLNNAKININEANLKNKIKTVVSDGFKNINDDYDVVVITGMGYELIKEILQYPHKKPNYYIIGTHNKVEDLRKYLNKHNYQIIDENVIYDKKYYIFLKIKEGSQTLTSQDIHLGPILKTKKEALSYYIDYLNRLLKIDEEHRSNQIKERITYLKEITGSK